MKTPEEIKMGLLCCAKDGCYDCPYVTECDLGIRGTPYDADALVYIRQLEGMAKPNEQIRWERDIAIGQLKELGIGFGEKVSGRIPKWISVEESLPEFHEKVVVSDGKHAWDYGMYSGWYGRKDEWHWKHNTVRHVKWWMPKKDALPEPPKEETE